MASLNTEQHDESRTTTGRAAATTTVAGQPSSELHVDDNPSAGDEVEYQTGVRVWLAIAAMYTALFLNGLVSLLIAQSGCNLADH